MRRINLQKSLIIVLYLCIILSFFWYSMKEVQKMNTTINIDDYVLSEQIQKDSVTKDEEALSDDVIYQELQNYQIYYQDEFNKQLIYVIAKFFIVFLCASITFWILMHKLQKKEKILIAKDLASLKQYQKLPDADPILKQAYETIQASYEQHFEDYKRLHSYLSHEQKNALALLQNNLELHEYDRCAHNIESLHQGIEDLLTISDSPQEGTLYPVDAAEVCARVCDDYRLQAVINFDFDEEECMIKAKERWIYRSIANLVDNAIKYGEGKPIEVRVNLIDDQVRILVKDHGIGIAKEQQERIFHHHVRIDELNKDGYGIGLSLVRHVAEMCHARIEIESSTHVGTAITLIFPVLHE